MSPNELLPPIFDKRTPRCLLAPSLFDSYPSAFEYRDSADKAAGRTAIAARPEAGGAHPKRVFFANLLRGGARGRGTVFSRREG